MNTTHVSFCLLIAECSAVKILLFTAGMSNSHVLFSGRLANILVQNGNNQVTMLIEQYNLDLKEVKLSPAVKQIHYNVIDKEVVKLMAERSRDTFNVTNRSINFGFWGRFNRMIIRSCDKMINDQLLFDKLQKEKFDLAIAHAFRVCPFGFIQRLNISKYIWYSSGLMPDFMTTVVGGNSPPSFVPHLIAATNDRMSLFDRLKASIGWIMSHIWFIRIIANPQIQLFKKQFGIGHTFPNLIQMASESALVLVNSEDFLDFAKPKLNKIMHVGMIGLHATNKLDEFWSNVMNSARNGIVLFSMGSIADTRFMPDDWIDAFLYTFAELPNYVFIWKFEGDLSRHKLPQNVIISRWVPQNDLLAHAKMKAFITHGGFNSLLESCIRGVPTVTIPLFADQFGNYKRAAKWGVAVLLESQLINRVNVLLVVKKVLLDESYSRNAKRLANILKYKSDEESNSVVKWIELVAKLRQTSILEPKCIEFNLLKFFNIDILIMIIIIFLPTMYLMTLFITMCVRMICRCISSRCLNNK